MGHDPRHRRVSQFLSDRPLLVPGRSDCFFSEIICIPVFIAYTLYMMTKKEIIAMLSKSSRFGTIYFGGLKTQESVHAAREAIIERWTRRVEAYKKMHPTEELNLLISDKQVCAGHRFQFLPAYPKYGKVVTGSKTFSVAGVRCDYSSIVPESFTETETAWTFQTNSGSVIIIQK